MPQKRYYGLIRQTPDPRDYQFRASRRRIAALAPTVDLSSKMGPLLSQGNLGACGPNTAAENIDYDESIQSLSFFAPSRLFIYYTTRMLMGTVGEDSGVDNRTMLQALAQYGYCHEPLWPYTDYPTTFTEKPTAKCFNSALPRRISNYAGVAVNLQEMKGVVGGGKVFIFGFEVFAGIESDAAAATGIVPDPGANEQSIGGHDVTFCGYSDVQQPGITPGKVWPAGTFRFRNHWQNDDGSPWGDGGYGYLSYAYATNLNLVSDCWVINAVVGLSQAQKSRPRIMTSCQD